MKESLIELVCGGAVAALSFVANMTFVSISYAVAAVRFESADAKEKAQLSSYEMRLIEKSKKVGVFAALGARFFLIAATFALVAAMYGILKLGGAEIGPNTGLKLVGLSIFITLFCQYVFCDLPGAYFASREPVKTIKRFSKIFLCFYYLVFPFEILARKVSEKFFGRKISEDDASFDHIDVLVKLRAEEEETEELHPYAKKIVRNSIRLNELEISDVMIPRSKVHYFDTSDPVEANLKIAAECGHTRYPLCSENLDNCIGIVRIKDIFKAMENGEKVDLMKIKRGVISVKHDDSMFSALQKLRRNELHMALVEDDFGGVIGVLTLDGILEEIVGQIKEDIVDESNAISKTGKNTFKVSGLAAIHIVEDYLGVDFNNDEVSTFGGLITNILGRFPEKGEKIRLSDPAMCITVEKAGVRRVEECKIELLESSPRPGEQEA
ncbi:MAG: CBS domain-containing protein [Opitutales bacterium]|nr:CBS domain-containing protein [Opitutales bacterium]